MTTSRAPAPKPAARPHPIEALDQGLDRPAPGLQRACACASDALLNWQHLVGNRAAQRLLQTRRAGRGAPRLAAAPSLQRQEDPEASGTETSLGSLLGLEPGDLTDSLTSFLPSLTPCAPATTVYEARALHHFVKQSYMPFSLVAFGPQTTGLWLDYLDTSQPLPRAARSFTGRGEIVAGFTQHHRSAEAEREIVDASAAALAGPAASSKPAPGGTATVPVTNVVPAATLNTRINNRADPMGLDFDSPATTIPGNVAGGIGAGGPPGHTTPDPDTRGVAGDLELQLDASGVNLTITPKLTFRVHDTVDFCPGNLGGTLARAETVPMSVLEATEARFGTVFAADVPFDVSYPGPGVAKTVPVSPSVTPPLPGPTPTPTPAFPRSGPAKTTGSLIRVRSGPGLSFPALRLLGESGTPITVITQVHGDAVEGNDVWDQIDGGYISDRYVAFDAGP